MFIYVWYITEWYVANHLGLEDQNSTSDSSLVIILKRSKVQRFYYYLCVRVTNMWWCYWSQARSAIFPRSSSSMSASSRLPPTHPLLPILSFNMTFCRVTNGRIWGSSMATGISSLLFTVFCVTNGLYLLLSYSFYWLHWIFYVM